MPQPGVAALDGVSFLFGSDMLVLRQEVAVGLPVIRIVSGGGNVPDLVPHQPSRVPAPFPSHKGDHLPSLAVNRHPDPALGLFFPVQCHISSSSIPSEDSERPEMGRSAGMDLIHLMMLTWLYPRRRPIARKPSPSRYSRLAFSRASRAAARRLAVAWVKHT